MLLKELTERSPMRIFENSIHGGLGAGNLGVLVGPRGTWKTAFLVDIALDALLRGRKVLHVTIGKTVEHVQQYYNDIFSDLARKTHLENLPEIRHQVESLRHINSYLDESFTPDALRAYAATLQDAMGFVPVAIVIDGYDFAKATPDAMRALRALARHLKCEVWMAAHADSPPTGGGLPGPVAPLASELAVIVQMAEQGRDVRLRVLKDHDNPDVSKLVLTIDPSTMLLTSSW